ncbi:hypothetical protein HG536_0C06250 [Torulaspora globosa]|uniref:Importin N-terminal domain-containing protein n=1 Tax=Torulaspora globosa TaxID=48254 RepID=A0A7G3ZG20_9SACH|nr:uncharacterized protein HG536_0C06250 [Torulaspora globosa]QLL32456.1 hypothetical protein HG536_0C06250 [Torulaspora globosa]
MDAESLLQCFACTLDPNAAVRAEAEQHLKRESSRPGFLAACLDIIASNNIPDNIKMSTSLYFKNKSVYGWSGNSANRNEALNFEIDNDEKPVIKDSLISTMLECSKSSPGCIRVLKSALAVIIAEEYPHGRWNSLLPKALELLSTDDMDAAYVGLLCLSEIFRTYRWKDNDSRQELEHLIPRYFPDFLRYANERLLNEGRNMDNRKIGEMLKLLLKIYKFVTYHDLPFTLQKNEMLIPWANLFVAIVQTPLSQQTLFIEDKETRKQNPWVKCKKWSYAILYRLFQRYASDSLTRKFDYNEFKVMFRDEFFPSFLQLLFQQVEQWGSGQLWLSDACIYYILSFIEQAIVQKHTWKLIKEHYDTILEYIIFPLLTPDEDSLDSFENDPQEYIHRNLELWDDSYSPDLAAASLLTTAVNKRGKSTLEPTLKFVISKLQANVGDLPNLQSAVKVESCLRIFSCIIDRLTVNNSPYMGQMGNFLKDFVFPFFNSPHGFLKARVCEICSKVGDVDFDDSTMIGDIYSGIMRCLNDETSALPVQLQAALALQTFIHDDKFQQALSTVVLPTMQKLLSLSNEFESDTISGVMQDFVEQFAEQLQPFGVELMNTLVQQFLKLAIDLNEAASVDPNCLAESEEIPDETDKQMAALGILSTTISILLSFESSPEIVKNLEQSFYPAAEFILNNNIEDFYRECCEFVENSSFLLRSISPISWKILELIGQANRKEDSMISFYLEDFMVVLNNYLMYGKEELKKNEFYSRIVWEIYQKSAITEDSDLDELVITFDLAQKLMLALEDRLPPHHRQKFLEDAMKAIVQEKKILRKNVVFGVTAFNVIIASVISSPLLTLQFLQHHNCLELFFETWLSFYAPNVKRTYDIKLSILALLSMMCQITPESFAQLSMESVVQILPSTMIGLISRFPAALQQMEARRKEYTTDSFKAESFNDWENDEEAYDDNEVDGEEHLREQLELLKGDSDVLNFVNGQSFTDGEDFDSLEEDPLTGSILDPINIYDVLKTSMESLRESSNGSYTAIIEGMTPDDRNVLSQLLLL